MKKLASVLAVLGGVAAVVWAMRDRLITIASPKEPVPPRFRVVPPGESNQAAGLVDGDDLTEVTGIGPVFAARLRAQGITTFEQLAAANAETVAEIAQVSASRARDWIEQAAARTG